MIRNILGSGLALALTCGCSEASDGPGDGVGGSAGAGSSARPDAGTVAAAGRANGPDPRPPAPLDAGTVTAGPVEKLDLLFMIDNSKSMKDKQALLQTVVTDLVSRLVNPICLDASGQPFPPPASGGDCPEGQHRQFAPVDDINIGVISSSLGDIGANAACPTEGRAGYVPDRVDLAHLVGSLPRGQGAANTPEGFLAWRAGSTDLQALGQSFQRLLTDTGENGCGWEASLESWYRFLVDPFPYRELVRVQCPDTNSAGLNCLQQATDAQGRVLIDETLLAQRRAFLRPDSMVAIVMLTDENDCSLQVGNQTWVVVATDDTRPMFRASSTCDSDPNAKCCFSCPLGPPAGCAADPICDADPASGSIVNRLPADQDGQNLRCYQQKRRFGVDFLYPPRRYVNALTQRELCWNDLELSTTACPPGDIVQNPLYQDGRPQSRVFLAGIVGVPWQAIAADVDADGRPLGAEDLRFQSASELATNGTWAQILGSPGVAWRAPSGGRPEVLGAPPIAPALPYMLESEFPRSGIAAGNAVNGREYDTTFANATGTAPDDLQLACIFPLAVPRDCAQLDPAVEVCDCYAGDLDRPVCEQTPGTSAPGTTQYWGKAYPGGRHLEVLQGYGDNSILASICARNVSDTTASDFGYRPALAAIVERLSEQLP